MSAVLVVAEERRPEHIIVMTVNEHDNVRHRLELEVKQATDGGTPS